MYRGVCISLESVGGLRFSLRFHLLVRPRLGQDDGVKSRYAADIHGCPVPRPLRASRLLRGGALAVLLATGCGIIKERPEDKPTGLDVVGKPMTSEQAKEVLGTVGGNFAYGPGLGDAALSVGTAVVFPPYALYLLGNAVLSVSGYEPVTISSLLPEEDGKKWSKAYDTVVSGPGRVVAAMAGHEYRGQEVAEQRLGAVLEKVNASAQAQPAEAQTIRSDVR